ncbi:MAG TPA: HAMP domain-containing sensor histidine kinase, partial [Hanamia sp.]
RNTQLDELNSELSVANETKAKLFGVISHDLRAPVSKIVNLLHLHKENSQNADEHVRNQYVERINRASENVLETMEDLLLWSKSQMEHFAPNLRDIQIKPLLVKETLFFEEQIKDKNLEIIIKCDENLINKTDENFLSVIIRNLLQNAISQSGQKSKISITADKRIISISNPIGKLSAGDLNSILQKKQVSSSQSGLGLQLVKDLAERIGINIFFDQKEEGTVQANLSWV